jgi:hypothetical protein
VVPSNVVSCRRGVESMGAEEMLRKYFEYKIRGPVLGEDLLARASPPDRNCDESFESSEATDWFRSYPGDSGLPFSRPQRSPISAMGLNGQRMIGRLVLLPSSLAGNDQPAAAPLSNGHGFPPPEDRRAKRTFAMAPTPARRTLKS